VIGKIAGPDDAPRPLDVWSALEGQPHPSVIYVVTMPLDLELATSAPLVLTRTERFGRVGTPNVSPDLRTQIGGRVRDRRGALLSGVKVSVDGRAGAQAMTNAAGEFAIGGLAPGQLILKIENTAGATTLVPVHVPSDSYDLVAD
jgi:hypothetical protein